ncbi:MAG: VCBS repeat-containing protein, partial [Candidatus Aminicenantes bacterium]|nr:VCBS repeat-containing protein [Candidatus Aminicenantes bacterium]
LQGAGGESLVIGQMDYDGALEIAVSDGKVVDTETKSVQWTWQEEFGPMLAAEDIDDDGRDELITCKGWGFVWAFDVNLQLPKWSLPCDGGIDSIKIADIDQDLMPELIVGDDWGDRIKCYSTATQNLEWEIGNPKDGINNLTVSDCDADGTKELIWGTDEGFLLVLDWQAETIEWKNMPLKGPFIGPEIGDIDGDGRVEIVCACSDSDDGDGPRLMAFSNNSTKLRALSDRLWIGSGWVRGVHALKLFDVDQDGRMEIIVAIEDYDGIIAIYDFAAEGYFNLKWTNSSRPAGTNFHSVEAGDVDGDGRLEIIAGSDDSPSGVNIYIYDYISGAEEWHSMHMGQNWNAVIDLLVEDVDGDTIDEIIGVVEGDDAYIFDGASKTLETILFGEFLSVEITDKGSNKLILLGDTNGYLSIHKHSAGNTSEIYRKKIASDSVYGLSFATSERHHVLFGSGGFLRCATTSATLWESLGYGSPFGWNTAFHPYSSYFVTCGLYSISLYKYQMY